MTDRDKLIDPLTRSSGVNESYRKESTPEGSPTTTRSPSKKKKLIIAGVVCGVALIALTVILILVLKKNDENPVDPVEPVYYDPYEVEATDPAQGKYTIKRNTKLLFNYPYQESGNNKFVDELAFQGIMSTSSFGLKFTDLSISGG